MSIQNIRYSASVPFPALVSGSGPIGIAKNNGVWTITYNVPPLQQQVPPFADAVHSFLTAYNTSTGQFSKIAFSDFIVAAGGTIPGGSPGQLQWNSAGSFGGISRSLWNDTTGNLVLMDGGLLPPAVASFPLGGAASILQIHIGTGYAYSGICFNNNQFSTGLALAKTRAATPGAARVIVQTNDALGAVDYYGDDGNALQTGAQVAALVDAAPAVGSMPTRLQFSTTPPGAITPTVRLTLDRLGNVVIGTAALVVGATNGFIHITSCPGVPSGTVTAYAGRVPLVYDSTDDRLYANNNGRWVNVTGGGVGGATAINVTGITGGVSGNFLYDNAGVYGERTPTQTAAALPQFSSVTAAPGVVPGSSGAAATSFLNATGNWSVPPAGGSGITGGAVHGIALTNSATTISTNVVLPLNNFLVGQTGADPIAQTPTQVAALLPGFSTTTGAPGVVNGSSGNTTFFLRGDNTWASPAGASLPLVGTGATVTTNQPLLQLAQTWNAVGTIFQGLVFNATNTASDPTSRLLDLQINGTSAFTVGIDGYHTWSGESRVTADQSFISTNTLANVPGLSVNVVGGRTYFFDAELMLNGTSTTGYSIGLGDTCTATNLFFDVATFDATSLRTNPAQTALNVVAATFARTTSNDVHIRITGTITVNASGTLTVKAAQNTVSVTAMIVRRGSTFIVLDTP